MEEKPERGKEEEAVQTKEEVARPKGPAPNATVSSRHDGGLVERQGRGFSMGELEGAEFPPAKARDWHLPIDIRRRTVLEGNIQALKKWFLPPVAVPKPKPAQLESRREAKKEGPKKRAPRKKATK